MKEEINNRVKAMEGEFDQTRAFIRQCMADVATGSLSHPMAQDIIALANAQNHNMALEATMFPRNNRGEPSSKLLELADNMVVETDIAE